MLLLLFSGTSATSTSTGSGPVVTHCGFQPSAFQNNAFQNCAVTPSTGSPVGWFDGWDPRKRHRHDPDDLERRLREQRGFTYEDFKELESPVPAAVPMKRVTVKAPGAAVSQVVTVAKDDLDDETLLAIAVAIAEFID